MSHLYHNIFVKNDTNVYQLAKFNEARQQPILNKPSDWYLSLVRFRIPANNIPIFKFQADKYIVSFRYFNGVNWANFEKTVVNIPQTYININGITTPSTYVYHYENFIRMINIAIADAFALFKLSYPAYPIANNHYPYLLFDKITGLISLAYDQAFYTDRNNIEFYMSNSLYQFFTSFETTTTMIIDPPISPVGPQNDPIASPRPSGLQQYAYKLPFVDLGNNYVAQIYEPYTNHSVSYAGYVLSQEFPCLYNWNDCIGLTIVTYGLPVEGEIYSRTGSNGEALSYKVLTDFQINTTNGPDARSPINYTPTAEYRLLNLISDNELRNTDFQIFWTSRTGEIEPLYIAPSDSFQLKLMYRSKSFNLPKML